METESRLTVSLNSRTIANLQRHSTLTTASTEFDYVSYSGLSSTYWISPTTKTVVVEVDRYKSNTPLITSKRRERRGNVNSCGRYVHERTCRLWFGRNCFFFFALSDQNEEEKKNENKIEIKPPAVARGWFVCVCVSACLRMWVRANQTKKRRNH